MGQLEMTLNQLQLWGMKKTMDLRLTEASSGGWKYSEVLEALLQDELSYREQKKTEYRIKRAKFRQQAHEDLFDFSVKRNLTKAQVKELTGLHFLEKKQSLLLLGPTGVGKTFLASAIGYHACQHGHECLFLSINNFIEQTQMHRTTGTFLRFKDRLIKCSILILDDFGLAKMSAQNVQDLYDVLEERYQQKSTIITSQIELNSWKDIITDKIMLEAIVDRLAHGIRIELEGDSYRKKQGLDKVKGTRGN
jgi:DNA replication protein DnaC